MIDDVKRRLVYAGRSLEAAFDVAKFRLKARFGLIEQIEILPYRGHGTDGEIFLKGRVLEEGGVTPSAQTDTIFHNLKNMARRFMSAEVPHAVVRARFGDREVEARADVEGFFDARFDLENPPSDEMEWHPVRLSLVSPVPSGQSGARATGRVLVPESDRAEFGVISDIDDTVVLSKAASVLKMFWIVLLNNAHTRLPFPGVGAFYEALHRGGDGSRRNPLFYVSSSPWNIYDLLVDFMDVHGVPAGPIFLKDWSPTVLGKHEDHKLGLIRRLLADYPDLPFVLIGDSGQEDPEIYHDAAIENPGRIQAIYIRDVTGEERRKEITALSKRLPDVQMKLVKDSAAAAEHALSLDLVSRESAREVFAASE